MSKLTINGGQPVRKKSFPEWPEYSNREIEELKDVLKSRVWNRWDGTKVIEFEDKFAKYHGAKYGIAVANGTAALEISLKAGGIGPGDEVIVPPYTFAATATSVLQVGGIPVFADINPETYCIDADDIIKKITDETRAIIPVHLYGHPADMDRIMKIGKEHNLLVIEDACQSPGAEWKGKKVGAIGDMGCFSFQASKNMTCGEGGIILTNNEKLAKKCYSYHHIGRGKGRPFYEHDVLGWNYRMSEFHGAILLAQFERLEEQSKKRETNARYLTKKLKEIEGITPPEEGPGVTRSSYHAYVFRYDKEQFNGLTRELFMEALKAEGIPCSTAYPIPLYKNPLFLNKNFGRIMSMVLEKCYMKELDYNKVSCPQTEKICQEAVFLKQSFLLGEKEDIDDIVSAIMKIKQNVNELL